MIIIISSSYHIVDLKRQNRLRVGTDKPKLKVKTAVSISDDDVRKRLLEKPRFELAAKGVFRVGRCNVSGRAFQVFGPVTGTGKACS